MARLPDVQENDVSGAPVSTASVAPTNFNLEQAGSELERAALVGVRAQSAADNKAAQPALVDAQGAMNDSLDKVRATYTGAPGLVSDQASTALGHIIDARQGLVQQGAAPGVLSEFDKGAQQLLLRHTQQVYEIQSAAQAKPLAQAFANSQASQVTGGLINAQSQIEPAMLQLKQGYADTTDPISFQNQGLAIFDQHAAAAIAALPPNLQPELQAQLQTERYKTAGDLRDFAWTHQQAGTLKAFGDQVNQGIDTIVSSPAAYSGFMAPGGTFDKLVTNLPRNMQADARTEYAPQAVEARIKSLVENKQGDAALQELDRGDYDQILTPTQKEALRSSAQAQDRADGPEAIAKGEQTATIEARLRANQEAIATTGRSILQPGELDADAKVIGGERVGTYIAQTTQLQKSFAATGPVAGMSNTDLTKLAATPAPDPSDPAYSDKIVTWQAQQQAAAGEIKARAQPGAWVFGNTSQTMDGTTLGAAMSTRWSNALAAAPGAPRAGAMGVYVGGMLGVQSRAGIGANQWQVVPQTTASALAAQVSQAPPEGRMKALQDLAGVIESLPPAFSMPDGAIAHPRAMLAAQLGKAGLTPIEASAVADFGDNPAALGRVVSALNNTALKGPAPRGDQIPALVRGDLKPFLSSDPQGGALAQARLDRTVLVARQLEAQGMAPESAAGAAAADLTGAYSYVKGWRMPQSVAAATSTVPSLSAPGGLVDKALALAGGPMAQVRGDKLADVGSQAIVGQLTANGGAGLFAPSTIPGSPADRQRIFASQVQQSGRWQTLPDDSGLVLTLPKPDGTFVTVADKYGRPVKASWTDLQGVASGRPSPFAAAPPTALTTPQGMPVRAVSKAEGFSALVDSVQYQETRTNPARINPSSGAIGAMQLKPETGEHYAQLLGIPWDPDRALHDVAYNRQIGSYALQDLVNQYGTGPGLGMALAAYNAGPGRVSGGWHDKQGQYHPPWTQTIGDPRGGQISLTDWVSRIPYPETRNYVQQVLQRAVGSLHAGQG